jgi:hypothetical protein
MKPFLAVVNQWNHDWDQQQRWDNAQAGRDKYVARRKAGLE